MVAIILSIIIILAFVASKPLDRNPSLPYPNQKMDDNKSYPTLPDDLVLPPYREAPLPFPQTDITQPLLHPVIPTNVVTKVPPCPKGSKDLQDILQFPCVTTQNPPLSTAYTAQDRYLGSPFGDVKIKIKLPQLMRCNDIGQGRPATFHLESYIDIHGTHLMQAAIGEDGYVIPHVYITSWNKYTGEVILRNDVTNWHGDITLAYFQQCWPAESSCTWNPNGMCPEWYDELESYKRGTYTVSIEPSEEAPFTCSV